MMSAEPRAVRLSRDSKRAVATTPAEDMLLQKLVWFREGAEASELQGRDVTALIRTLGEELDWDDVRSWAERRARAELRARARRDAAG